MASASSTIAARLDRLPRSRYTRNLIILISLGGCFELYDLFFGAYIAAGLFAGKLFTPTTQMFFGF
ncbi:MAG TPA: MFS transporter, partial [Reyranella sp.]